MMMLQMFWDCTEGAYYLYYYKVTFFCSTSVCQSLYFMIFNSFSYLSPGTAIFSISQSDPELFSNLLLFLPIHFLISGNSLNLMIKIQRFTTYCNPNRRKCVYPWYAIHLCPFHLPLNLLMSVSLGSWWEHASLDVVG